MPNPPSRLLLAALPLRPATTMGYVLASTPVAATTKTHRRHIGGIPPEAPAFSIPPIPLQSTEVAHKRERGHLPVPRRIMRNDKIIQRKSQKEFILSTAPWPKPRTLPYNSNLTGPKTALSQGRHDIMALRWKQRSARNRRENLQAGIKALVRRKSLREEREAKTNAKRREAAAALASRPLDEAERLTRPTVPLALLDTAVRDDPDRFKKALESTKRTRKMLEDHAIARRDSLVALYVNAKNFIITEEQLEKEVARQFSETYLAERAGSKAAQSIWDVGSPQSMGSSQEWTATGQMGDAAQKKMMETADKQKRVAEALTGGKLDVPEAS